MTYQYQPFVRLMISVLNLVHQSVYPNNQTGREPSSD